MIISLISLVYVIILNNNGKNKLIISTAGKESLYQFRFT